MEVVFFKSRAENNRLDKTDYIDEIMRVDLTPAGEIDGSKNLNTETPEFVMELSSIPEGVNLRDINYFYVPVWDSWYFINGGMTLTNGGNWHITGKRDVLMTYKQDILELEVVTERNEISTTPFIPDPAIKMDVRPRSQSILFKDALNGYSILLITLGGTRLT